MAKKPITRMKSNGLTAKQEAYCLARASGLAGRDAYRKAFPTSTANQETARREALRLEARPLIKMRIAALVEPAKQAMAEAVTANLLRTVTANAEIAHSDIRDLLTPDGRIKPPSEWPDDAARVVSSYTEVEGKYGRTKKITIAEKGAALDREMRHLGGYEKDKGPATSPLDGIPRAALKALLEALRERLNGPIVAEQPQSRRLAKPRRRG